MAEEGGGKGLGDGLDKGEEGDGGEDDKVESSGAGEGEDEACYAGG